LSSLAAPVSTARITPELFTGSSLPTGSRVSVVLLSLILLTGLGFRLYQLGSEGLSEDELNKLVAVQDYRAHGLTAANGEHPMLMKAIMTASILAVESWNSAPWAKNPSRQISTESALRLPGVILGSLVAVLLFLVTAELFGSRIGLLAAAFWAHDPNAIAFSDVNPPAGTGALTMTSRRFGSIGCDGVVLMAAEPVGLMRLRTSLFPPVFSCCESATASCETICFFSVTMTASSKSFSASFALSSSASS